MDRLREALTAAARLVETTVDLGHVASGSVARVSRVQELLAQAAGWVGALEQDLDAPTLTEGPNERPTARPPADDVQSEGEIIAAQYRVVSLIGRGGMGTVVLAWDDKLQRHVAIKLLEHDVWGDADARHAFEREARAMARVHHPNVVTIHALGEHNEKPFIVMEYVQGKTLRDYMTDGPLALDEALGIVDQLCRGVAAIHRAGVVHRDIKPSNILLGPAFRVAVTDFGLVDAVGTSAPPVHGGTPGYVAPETLERGVRAGPEADIYAVGIIMHELLTGIPAFAGDTVEEVVTAQLVGRVASLSSHRGDLPSGLDAVITKATALDPADRHPSIEDLRAELFEARKEIAERYEASVMIVEDHDEFRELLEEVVQIALPGARTQAYGDGLAALEAAKRERFDAALIDLGLPGLNGFELIALLRQLDDPVPQVVVVTGEGGAADWELLHRSGAAGFLLKPVDDTALTALLRKLIPKSKKGARLSRVPQVVGSRARSED
ncbi:MAG: serine/threonine-protein kinase [Polyangiaceae bacterium]